MLNRAMLLSTAQHSTAQHSTAQHSTAQHSTAQHSTAQHSTAQHRLTVSFQQVHIYMHYSRRRFSGHSCGFCYGKNTYSSLMDVAIK